MSNEAPPENPRLLQDIVPELKSPESIPAERLNAALKAKSTEIIAAARGRANVMRTAINVWLAEHGVTYRETAGLLEQMREKIISNEALTQTTENAAALGRYNVQGLEGGLVDVGTGISEFGKTVGSGSLPEAAGHAMNASRNLIAPTVAIAVGAPLLRNLWENAKAQKTFGGRLWGFTKAILGSAAVLTGGVLLYNTIKKGVNWAFNKEKEAKPYSDVERKERAPNAVQPAPAAPAPSLKPTERRAEDAPRGFSSDIPRLPKTPFVEENPPETIGE